MPQSYPYLRISLPEQWVEALEAALSDLPTQGWLTEGSDPLTITAYFATHEEAREGIPSLHRRLTTAGLSADGFEISPGQTDEEDWETAWRETLHPLRIGTRWLIRASWHPEDTTDRTVLVVDPKMAFGTGTHPTTSLCLVELERLVREGTSVLDVGSGTGILAMAAHRLGARPVVGVEIDPDAARCARENLAANDLAGEIDMITGSLEDVPPMSPSLIVANIQYVPLLALAPHLKRMLAPGGTALFSGILQTEADDFIGKLQAMGWNIVRRRRKFDPTTDDGWVCIIAESTH